jgi:hypothetical protein
MLKIYRYLLIAVVIFSSCRSTDVIPPKDMASILVKFHLIDATVSRSDLRKTYFNKDSIDYYAKAIQSFGYTQNQFDSSLKYYTNNPILFDAIYDKVIIELSNIETKVATESMAVKDSVVKDTLQNLWNLNAIYELPTDGPRASVDYKIPTKGPGIYTISAEVMLYQDDQSINPAMTAYFFFDDQSKEGKRSQFTTKLFQKMKHPQTYTIQMELRNSLVTHLRGSLLGDYNSDPNYIKHIRAWNISVHYKPFPHKGFKFNKRNNREKLNENKQS